MRARLTPRRTLCRSPGVLARSRALTRRMRSIEPSVVARLRPHDRFGGRSVTRLEHRRATAL
jgi:hypothetical protein